MKPNGRHRPPVRLPDSGSVSNWSALLLQHAHRPYPLPRAPWFMTMRWRELLFAHWSIEPATLRPLLPAALELDTREGRAWVGVVPFRMEKVGPRGLNWLPGLSAFPEANVRTYVVHDGRPGVWFFSLDAASRFAVRAARLGFHLPYYDAAMRCQQRDGWVDYATRRKSPAGEFTGRYRPTGAPTASRAGTLEHWLTERYCLYAVDRRGRLRRGEIHHAAWPLQPAQAEIRSCTIAEAWGLDLRGPPELLHYAERLDVLAWPLARS